MSNVFSLNNSPGLSAFQDIFSQYINEAAFLWLLRSIAINEPHNDNLDIIMLDKRIDEQVNGLMSSMDIGWQACLDALELEEPGEIFVAMIIAMRSHDSVKIRQVVDKGFNSDNTLSGLISAMAWLPSDITKPWIERFINGKDFRHKYLGIASCSVCRIDPGSALVSILKREDCIQDIRLYCRAIRLVGELRRQDCMPLIEVALHNSNEQIQFWVSWSMVLLGKSKSVDHLKSYLFKANNFQNRALQLVFRVLNIDDARNWISDLSKDENKIRTVIKCLGVLGDPHAINWLILKMKEPLYAKLAAESFYCITGIDLTKANLSMPMPDDYPIIPNDDLDDQFVGMDEDENLPYPNVEKIALTWQKYGNKFVIGKRYFMGSLITTENLNKTLNSGMQRYRHAAALELALSDNAQPLMNTKSRSSLI